MRLLIWAYASLPYQEKPVFDYFLDVVTKRAAANFDQQSADQHRDTLTKNYADHRSVRPWKDRMGDILTPSA